jgi:hypothetical protein
MRPANAEGTPTLAEVVHRAVQVVDPEGNRGSGDFLARFEDRDEPIAGLQDQIEQEVAEKVGAIDPQEEDPVIQMAGAVTTYLAFRRDEITDVREDILRLAARAEYDGNPPDTVRDWLEAEGVAM